MDIYRIVFTGGPCAGKTTIIDKMKQLLENDDYYVIVVPETAAELISKGIIPHDDKKHTLRFQELVLETQTRKEITADEYCRLIKNSNLDFIKDKKGIVVLYDRGIPDNRAYLSHNEYNNMLKKYNYNELAIIDKYDLVINLVSLATTNPELYSLDEIRYEPVEEASYKDMLTSSAWCLHRNFEMIRPTDKIEEKISLVYNTISNKLNNKCKFNLIEYELDENKTSFNYFNEDNSRKMKVQIFKLQTASNLKLTLEKREYEQNVSYILKEERLAIDGILSNSKTISKNQFDSILRNNFLSEVQEQEILNFVDKGNFFSIIRDDLGCRLYIEDSINLEIPRNITIKNQKNFTKKNNMII